MTDDEERRYLRQATRGLWGRKRRELQAELRGHLGARRQELQVGGLGREEATWQALRELGEPGRVSRGLAGVYLLPGVARGAALSTLLCGAAFLAAGELSRGLAQVQGYQPVYAPAGPFTYLDLGSLQAELQGAGVGIAGLPERPVLTFPGASRPVVVETGAEGGELEPYLRRTLVRDYGSGQVYLDARTLAGSLLNAGLNVRVEGWLNPVLRVGNVALRLGTPARPVNAYNLYSLALAPLARDLGVREPYSARWSEVALSSTHRVRVPGAQPGEVYALVSVMRSPSGDSQASPLVLAFDLAQPGAGGELTFALPYDMFYLELTGNPEDLRADARRLEDPAQRLRYAGPDLPAHALLLRLDGELSPGAATYTVIPRTGRSVGD